MIESVVELEKVYKIVIFGFEEERVVVVSIFCGVFFVCSWIV